MRHFRFVLFVFCGLMTAFLSVSRADSSGGSGGQAPVEVQVFAASSLTDVLPRLGRSWRQKHPGVELKFSFEASSSLARQIVSGAPADLFFSADEDWVDFLQKKGQLEPGGRFDVAGNELVVVVPADQPDSAMPASAKELAGFKVKKVALANENVPSAKYGRHALESLKVWTAVSRKLLRAANVRASLKWVVLGEADAAIVYATDALIEKKVKVAFVFPQSSYPPIRYAAAVVKSQNSKAAATEARAFLDYCRGPDAAGIWHDEGFREAPR